MSIRARSETRPARQFLPEPLPADPMPTVAAWLRDAHAQNLQPNPNSMVLVTVGARNHPSARVVLCKELVVDPGYLVFHTNYESRKGRELAENPRAAAVLHWDKLSRQVRIEGVVVKSPASESDAYFATRAWQSQLGAWASRQSEPIASRRAMQQQVGDTARALGLEELDAASTCGSGHVEVPRPSYWGGYRLWAESVELWVTGDHRIHDRARWTRSLSPAADESFIPSPWESTRLQP